MQKWFLCVLGIFLFTACTSKEKAGPSPRQADNLPPLPVVTSQGIKFQSWKWPGQPTRKPSQVARVEVAHLSSQSVPEPSPSGISENLELTIDIVTDFVNSDRLTPENCAVSIGDTYQAIYTRSSHFFDRALWTNSSMGRMVKKLWELRLSLRKKLLGFYQSGKDTEGCANAMRDAMRAARFVEDYVGFVAYGKPTGEASYKKADYHRGLYFLSNSHPEPTTEGVVADSKYTGGFDLRSGDILLSKGLAITSAAIARIGKQDSQFSHLAMVYVDPQTRRPYTVESHIEYGNIVTPFEEYIGPMKTRVVQYRYHDGAVAHKAAEEVYTIVKTAQDSGDTIEYDFAMDLKDRKRLFCSEVVNYGYSLAREKLARSDIAVPPLYKTDIRMKNRGYLDKIGVKALATFAPADMEVDPRFEMVSEWRDYARMPDGWMQDMALTKIYEWMDEKNYKIHSSIKMSLAGDIVDALNIHLLIRGSSLKEAAYKWAKRKGSHAFVPPTGETITAAFTMNIIGGMLYKKLKERVDKMDVKPTPWEMLQLLEEIRAKEAKEFNVKNPFARDLHWGSNFHTLFRPD